MAIVGIILAQSFWLMKTWDLKDDEFNLSVNIALKNVANSIANFDSIALPKTGLIQRQSSNIYAVNINSTIDANILEDYLFRELSNVSINTDFEYGVYDCASSEMLYGNYCRVDDLKSPNLRSTDLPKFDDLIYYFVVKFPLRKSYLLTNMKVTLIFAGVAVLSVLFFTLSMFVIMRQKRHSDLQKDFINNMTHEFKTPISSIKIASNAIAKHEDVAKNEKLLRYIKIIDNQNQRLNDQVEKVLNIAKVENESLKISREEVNLTELIIKIQNSENLKSQNHNIKIDLPKQKVIVNADTLHLTNIIYNLLDNALKYCIGIPNVKIELEENKGQVILKIRDQGIGLTKDDQKMIFTKFYRVSTGNVHNVKGFGLGLFYVKNICEVHGWTIDVTSEIGKGSCFNIQIPKN